MRRLAVIATFTLAGTSLLACTTKSTRAEKADMTPSRPTLAPLEGGKLTTVSSAEFSTRCLADLQRAKDGVEALAKLDGKRDPKGVLETYDALSASLANAASRASVVRNSHPDAALREAADVCEQEAEKVNTVISLDRRVFDALSAVELDKQDEKTRTLVTRAIRDLRRSGVDRDEATREKVKALNEELTLIGQAFGKNIREDVRWVELAPKQLEGMPEDYKRAHPVKDGKVRISTDYPDYVPFVTYAKDPKAREALWRAYRMRGHPKNLEVLSNLIAKRHELATLLGYPNWAAYVTETKMIGSAQKAAQFIDQVNQAAEVAAKREFAQLLALKKKEFPKATSIEPWEQDYYEDKLKASTYGFDSQLARPYFEYGNVLSGVLDVTSRMFQIKYVEVPDAEKWHPDVRVFDVFDASGEHAGRPRGRVFLDMHPRADKYKHAAQFDLVTGQEGKVLPEGVLMCNFPQPTEGGEPALMQPREVETFFHEFGHLLHHIFGGHQRWIGQSGIKTEWDFVEAPSMMLQEWAQNADALARFAKHHQTGEPIPAELVKRMVAAKEFGKGLFTRRQMYLAAVSLNFYNREPGFDTTKLATELQAKFEPFRKEFVPGSYMHLSFGHLDGYSAIYYTYIWSSVIARDLLTVFEQEGFLNPEPAARYRQHVLEPGGSKDAALLVKDFLGRDYAFEAYEKWLNTPPGEAPSVGAN